MAVDDFGRFDARPEILKAELFLFDDTASPADVFGWVVELAEVPEKLPPVRLYEVEGRPYLCLTGWEKHRGKSHRAKRSKYPAPPQGELNPEPPGNSHPAPGDPEPLPDVPGASGRSAEDPEDPPVSRESGVGSRESRVESRESRTPPVESDAPSALGGPVEEPNSKGNPPEEREEPEKPNPEKLARERLAEIWPALRAKANEGHGKAWREKPSKPATALLLPLLKRGTSEADLLAAIDGCAILNPDRPDRTGSLYIRPETIYRPSKFEGYVDAAREHESTPMGKPKSATDRYLERTASPEPAPGSPPREVVHTATTEDRHSECTHTDRNSFPCPKCGNPGCASCLKQPCEDF